MNSNNRYRPDIDGLRAVAVLSVVFYHAGLGFPGGYVGVDVFFVISGYLITGLIVKDLERGTFSLANFWERRIRRIFPALAVMVAATMVAGWFLLLPDDLAKLGASVIAQSLLVSNFYFWRTTNYFGGANEEKPLLHTWSLAVEEQFYLIFPIVLMAIWFFFNYRLKKREERNLTTIEQRGWCEMEQPEVGPKGEGVGTTKSNYTECTEVKAGARLAGQAGAAFSNPSASQLARDSENTSLIRSADTPSSLPATSYPPPVTSPIGDQRRWPLFWIFAAVALVSFGISIWGVKAQPFATFFLLPTRAWELLLGSMLAVLPATVLVRSAALRGLFCFAGLAGIFLPVFYYGEQTPFPGLAALPPCFGTALLICANTARTGAVCQGYFARALSWGPIVFIGLISYSLYLYHWPIFAYIEYWKIDENNTTANIIGVSISFLIGFVSWNYIEQPFRRRNIAKHPANLYIITLISSSCIFLTGTIFTFSNGCPNRFSPEINNYLAFVQHENAVIQNFEKSKFKRKSGFEESGIIEPIPLGDSNTNPTFILFGDSHARFLAPFIDEIARGKKLSGSLVTHTATPPLIGWRHGFSGLSHQDPDAFFYSALEYAKRQNISQILLTGYWSTYQKYGGENDLLKSLNETVAIFKQAGIHVYLLLDHPTYDIDVPRSDVRSKIFPKLKMPEQEWEMHHLKNSAMYKFADKNPCIVALDPAKMFLKADTKVFKTEYQDKPLYIDSNHLSYHGIRYAWMTQLENVFSQNGDKNSTRR